MRNITDEQIEKTFENEEETRRRNSAYATAVEKICCIDGSKLITGWQKRWKYIEKKGVLQ